MFDFLFARVQKTLTSALGDGVYYYNSTVDAREEVKNVVVFNGFTITDGAEVAEYEGKTITVQGYAIQADGFANAVAAWDAAPATWGAVAE